MATKNDIAVIDTTAGFLALSPNGDFREAMEANLSAGETLSVNELIRIKVPAGGGKTWQYVNGDGQEVESKTITGLLVHHSPLGQLWGSSEPTKGSRPVLTSYDLRTAVRTNDSLGDIDADQLDAFRIGDRTYDWEAIGAEGSPFGWGSGAGGVGRRVKESRTLVILQPGEMWPVVVSVGAGSLKKLVPSLRRMKFAHYRTIVSLSLQRVASSSGIDYSQVVLSVEGTISSEDGALIRKMYTDPLSRVAHQIDLPQDAA